MDPWADGEDSAGPSAWPTDTISATHTSSSPPRRASNQPSVDPWAEGEQDVNPTAGQYSTPSRTADISPPVEANSSSYGNDGTDFDPWGGGAPPPIASTVVPTRSYSNESIKVMKRGELDDNNDGWQPLGTDLGSSRDYRESVQESTAEESDEPTSLAYDEEDPWGSGAKARQLKAERDAEAAARQMEILEIKEGGANETSTDENVEIQIKDLDKERASKSGEKTEDDAAKSSEVQQATNSGWRSLFSRGNVKAAPSKSVDMERKSSEAGRSDASGPSKASPSMANSIAAARLWQAPTLRTGHAKTSSNASQGSAAKDLIGGPAAAQLGHLTTVNNDSQGPGWTISAKKQSNASGGGFLSSLLSTAREGNNSRPPVTSADEADESGETDGTGLEWDAGDQFDSGTKKAPAKDLLSNDEPMQDSTVSRLIGRWRNRQAGAENSKQQDDLSWLENIGSSGAPTQQSPQSRTDEEDWLAFIGDEKPATNSITATSTTSSIPKAGGRIVIPNIGKKASMASSHSPGQLLPPPRGGTPTQRNVNNTQLSPYDVDETPARGDSERKQNIGAYRDEPESYDDTLLRQDSSKQRVAQSRNTKSSLLSSFSGRPVRPYTFDDDEEAEERDDSWSAFRDAEKYRDSNPVRPAAIETRNPIPSASSAAVSTKTIAPPPAPAAVNASARLPPPDPQRIASPPTVTVAARTTAASKTLSQGKTLTNDDLSFFENL